MDSLVTWYSMGPDLQVVDQSAVSQQEALAIVDDYVARIKDRWENGVTALAETMFGFQRGKNAFIELCLHRPQQISCAFEITMPRKILFLSIPKIAQTERTLRSVDTLKHLIRQFFELEPEQFLKFEKLAKS